MEVLHKANVTIHALMKLLTLINQKNQRLPDYFIIKLHWQSCSSNYNTAIIFFSFPRSYSEGVWQPSLAAELTACVHFTASVMALKRQKMGAATIYEGALRCHSVPAAVRLQEPRQPMTFWGGARLTGRYVPDIPSGEKRDGCFSSNSPHLFRSNSEVCVEPKGAQVKKKNWIWCAGVAKWENVDDLHPLRCVRQETEMPLCAWGSQGVTAWLNHSF